MGAQARAGREVSSTLRQVRDWLRDRIPWTGRGLSYGARCERVAARYLWWRGFRIIARNFRASGAEIDLIAIDGGALVFVEVKARRSLVAGTPEQAVDERKQRRIRRAAEIFADRHNRLNRPIRFDVVAITGDGRGRKLEHLKDAF